MFPPSNVRDGVPCRHLLLGCLHGRALRRLLSAPRLDVEEARSRERDPTEVGASTAIARKHRSVIAKCVVYPWRLPVFGPNCDTSSHERLTRVITEYATMPKAQSQERPKSKISGYTPVRPCERDSTEVDLLQPRSREGIEICFIANSKPP